MSRIIAGTARGFALSTPAGAQTRPTTDRTREAVFSALASWAGRGDAAGSAQLAGLGFLDLFAGSGAMGLEAASRGAARVVLVENHAATARVITHNVAAVRRADHSREQVITVITATARAYLSRACEPFDIVWADPPYGLANAEIEALLARVVAGGWLTDDGIVLVERSSRGEPFAWPDALPVRWRKVYGETQVCYGRPG
jgi:16S rRNA (guanine966-N2)-methyltransferase